MSNHRRDMRLEPATPLTSFGSPLRPLFRAWQQGLFQTVTLEHLARLAGVPYSALLDEARHHYDASGSARPVGKGTCDRCHEMKPAEEMTVGAFDRFGRALPGRICLECDLRSRYKRVLDKPLTIGSKTRKQCFKCKRFVPVSGFGSDRRRPDGLNRYCLECCRSRSAKHREKVLRTIKVLRDWEMKTCSKCGRELPGAEFSHDRTRHDGRRGECRSCLSKAVKDRSAARQRERLSSECGSATA